MTNKEIKQFTKDMLKIVSKQSERIKANNKDIKALRGIIENKKNPLVKEVERFLNNKDKVCYINAILSESNRYLTKKEIDEKMQGFNKGINDLMISYGVENVKAKFKDR